MLLLLYKNVHSDWHPGTPIKTFLVLPRPLRCAAIRELLSWLRAINQNYTRVQDQMISRVHGPCKGPFFISPGEVANDICISCKSTKDLFPVCFPDSHRCLPEKNTGKLIRGKGVPETFRRDPQFSMW
jgi:hypothetical protein